jgi:hypothetical protein
VVHNVEEVAKVVPETQAVRIAHTVGKKKRVQIIAEAKKLNIAILNFKEAKVAAKEEAEEEAKPAEAGEKADKKAKKEEKPKKEQKKTKKGAE